MRKKAPLLIFTILLILAFSITFAKPANATAIQTIVIQADGSISPSSMPIQRNGNVYTFTDNISATMRIEKSNIVLDGAGYTLYGPYNGTQADVWVIGEGKNQLPEGVMAQYTIGIDLANENVGGIEIKGLNIKNFSIAMYMWTKNNTIIENSISENIVGVLLSGANNTITGNYIAHNKQGLFFGFNEPSDIPADILISHNGFDAVLPGRVKLPAWCGEADRQVLRVPGDRRAQRMQHRPAVHQELTLGAHRRRAQLNLDAVDEDLHRLELVLDHEAVVVDGQHHAAPRSAAGPRSPPARTS